MFKNLSIKTKLISIVTLSLLSLAFIIAYISITNATNIQLKDKFEQLKTVEFVKHSQLKDYFKTTSELLTTTAANIQTQTAMFQFDHNFYRLKQQNQDLDIDDITRKMAIDYEANYLSKVDYDLPNVSQQKDIKNYLPKNINALIAQYIFITSNLAPTGKKNLMFYDPRYPGFYMNKHKFYHKIFNNLIKTFKLYDIFLINLKGDVVYTYFKEKDFATNLYNGAYKNSGLAKVYKKAIKLKNAQIAFEDFAPYEPSYNKPAAFISTPIYSEGKLIGVLAFQLSSDKLTKMMQFNGHYKKAGLGQTGEVYLVGEDYTMRTNSRFIDKIQDKNIKKLHTSICLKKIKTKAVQDVLNGNGKRSTNIIKDYNNQEVLTVYHIVHPFGKNIKWALVAQINKSEVLTPINKVKDYIIYSVIFLLFIALIISIMLINNIILNPLVKFQNGLNHFFSFLKGEEKDIKLLEDDSQTEIGLMSKAVNQGIIQIKSIFDKEQKNIWIRDGVGKLNAIFVDTRSIKDVTSDALGFIANYLEANVGAIYLYDEENKILTQDVTYSYTPTKSTKTTYSLGEGVVGQVALDKKEIILTHHIDKNSDLIINTATTSQLPKSTYTFALVYNNKLYGVIELGSLKKFSDRKIEFLKAVSKITAIAISTALQNQNVQKLLEQTKQDNINLEKQQQKLEEANVNMEEQQQKLEETNAYMEEQQQELEINNKNLKLAQDELRKKAKDLELASKYKGEFLANMSHELRTPLNAIILLSKLLLNNKQNNLSQDDIKKAKTIFTSGNELLRLINDILDLSKVEAGKIEIIIDQFNPDELLENLKNLYLDSAKEKGLEFNIINRYNQTISSDMNRISQILKNLISNALKFTKEGSIDVIFEQSNNKQLPIQIIVKDTGIGIPQDKQQDIFEAFTQVDGSISRQYGGTGLGLSIVVQLVSLLGGTIKLESTENKGSQFIINLPNLDQKDLPNNIEDNSNNKPKDESKQEDTQTIEINNIDDVDDTQNTLIVDEVDLDGVNVLVVDDDIKNIFVLDGVLHEYNANSFTAFNGQEALKLLETNQDIDIVLLDLMMPVMDGFETIKNIRNHSSINKDIPIIIVSAKVSQEDKDRSLELGANDFITKPFNMQNLISIIQVYSSKAK